MTIRTALLLTLTLVLALSAGVSSIAGSSVTPTQPDVTVTTDSTQDGLLAGPSAASVQQSPTDTPNTSADFSYPSGYDASGITDSRRAAEEHASTLFDRESFTVSLNVTGTTGGSPFAVTAVQRADIDAERIATNVTASGGFVRLTADSYRTADTVYTRQNSSLAAEPRYDVSREPFSVNETTTAPTSRTLQQYLGNASYGSAQPVTRDGETLIRYESTELLDASAFFNESVADENVSDFRASVLVDSEGLIHELTYSATYIDSAGEQVDETTRYQVTEVDTTTVPEPDWLGEARASVDTTGTETSPTTRTGSATTSTPATAQKEAVSTTPSPTATPVETEATATESGTLTGTRTGGGEDESSGAFGPGFGIVGALLALLVVVTLATRRR